LFHLDIKGIKKPVIFFRNHISETADDHKLAESTLDKKNLTPN
ncbi:unnamed protein product, partial [marine sediment metagenome]